MQDSRSRATRRERRARIESGPSRGARTRRTRRRDAFHVYAGVGVIHCAVVYPVCVANELPSSDGGHALMRRLSRQARRASGFAQLERQPPASAVGQRPLA